MKTILFLAILGTALIAGGNTPTATNPALTAEAGISAISEVKYETYSMTTKDYISLECNKNQAKFISVVNEEQGVGECQRLDGHIYTTQIKK